MKNKLIVLGTTALMFGIVINVNAAIMQVSLELEITELGGVASSGIWDIGDTVNISAVYDDESTERHYYRHSNGELVFTETGLEGDETFIGDFDFTLDSNLTAFIDQMEGSSGWEYYNLVTGYDNGSDVWTGLHSSYPNYNFHVQFGGMVDGTIHGRDIINGEDVDDIIKVRTIGSTLVSASPVPEPTTIILFGAGIAGLGAVGRRRK